MVLLESDRDPWTNGHARNLPELGKSIKRDAEALAVSVQDAIGSVEQSVGGQMRQRPYTTLAVAAGAGFVLGGGLATRLTRLILGVGSRLALAMVVQELGVRAGLTRSNNPQPEPPTQENR